MTRVSAHPSLDHVLLPVLAEDPPLLQAAGINPAAAVRTSRQDSNGCRKVRSTGEDRVTVGGRKDTSGRRDGERVQAHGSGRIPVTPMNKQRCRTSSHAQAKGMARAVALVRA